MKQSFPQPINYDIVKNAQIKLILRQKLMKKIILIIVLIAVIGFGLYQIFIKKPASNLDITEVLMGNISQEVSETGQVKKGEEINLAFKSGGKIEKIYVVVGEEVKRGDILAKIESKNLAIQLEDAKANLAIYQSKYDKLLAGAGQEEIQVARTAVSNAEIDLATAKQSLSDKKAQADEDLKASQEDALNILEDASLKAGNAFSAVDTIYRNYFTGSDQESLNVKENKEKIETTKNTIKSDLIAAKATPTENNIINSVSNTKNNLDAISNSLKIIRENCDTTAYQNKVSSTDKSSLDTQRGYINTALTNIVDTQQDISSTKLGNTTTINTAQAKVDAASGALKASQDALAKLTAPPRKEDVDLYQAQIKQAETQVELIKDQIGDTYLVSPINGQITQIEKEEGEYVQSTAGTAVFVLLPRNPFQIKADIYEEDIVKVKTGNPADISLIAFPDEIFKGKVVSLNPASKLIEGVVYYEITVDFDNTPQGLKPGMTADIVIKTASKENVLVISKSLIEEKDGKNFVRIYKNGNKNNGFEEREIVVGLEGKDGMVEVVSGLKNGEKLLGQ